MTSPTSGRPLPSSFDENEDFYNESGLQKVLTKMKREPLIPFGCLLTVAAFTNAYRAMRKGDHHQVQRMFRARVAAQGFTVVAIVGGGLYYGAERQREREQWKAAAEEKADIARQKWIRELEARDEEEKDLKARLERRKEKKRAADAEAAKVAFRTAAAGTEVSAEAISASEEAKAAGAASTSASSSKSGSGWGLFGGSREPKQGDEQDTSSQSSPQAESPKK